MEKMTKRIALMGLTVAVSMATSGCSFFNIGEEEFACTGMPDSVYCHSARDVYYATNDGSVPSRVGKDGSYNENCTDCVRSEGDRFDHAGKPQEDARHRENDSPSKALLNGQGDEVINNYVSPRLPTHAVPIRTPAVVMRIWIAPWVDDHDNLNSPGYVYTEIEPRRWIYQSFHGEGSSASFKPLLETKLPQSATHKRDLDGHNSLEKLKEKNNAQLRAR